MVGEDLGKSVAYPACSLDQLLRHQVVVLDLDWLEFEQRRLGFRGVGPNQDP